MPMPMSKTKRLKKYRAVKKILEEFWKSESPNGARHACYMPTKADNADNHPSMRVLSIERAAEKIVNLFEE